MKKKIRKEAVCRRIIQAVFFFAMPAAFASGFSGVKQIFTKISGGAVLELNSFTRTLLFLLLFTMIFGRFFCGYICAFGSAGDLIYGLSGVLQKKLLKRKKQINLFEKAGDRLRYIKYAVLLFILGAVFFGWYSKLRGTSPWDVFSRLTVFKKPVNGYTVGIALLIMIVVGMALCERFFCRFLCPMGAVFSLLPVLPFSALKRNEEDCIKNCGLCKRNCPVKIKPSEGDDGECISCGRCKGVCPKKNIGSTLDGLLRVDAAAALVKAGIFFLAGALLGMCRFF